MKHLISFDQDGIGYLYGKAGERKLVVKKAGMVSAPGAIVGGRIRDHDALLEALKQLKSKYSLSEKKVTVVLSGSSAATRELNIPAAQNEKELRETIVNEMLYRHSGMDTEYVIDYMVLPEKEQTKGINVLAMAIQQDCLESYLNLLVEAGLNCELIDLQPNCIGKLMHFCYPKLQSSMVACITRNAINLLLIEGEVCIISRTVALNIEQFEEAGSLDFLAEEISGHLDKMLSFQTTRRDAIPVEKILLLGESTLLEKLLPLIAKDQELECVEFEASSRIKLAKETSFSEYAKQLGALIRRS